MRSLKNDFPIFKQEVNGYPLTYLDNAATTHKPQTVIDAELDFYSMYNANIHRGIHFFGEHATRQYESARAAVAAFIGSKPHEVVFTQGTTAGINAVGQMWGMAHLKAGDEIVLTELEHHANLLVWQRVAQKVGATLKFIPINAQGLLILDDLERIITPKTTFVSIIHVSNMLGTHVDVATIIARARAVGAKVLIDAAQSVAHQKIDVQKLDPDFLVFSGHKLCGPTGIGVLYIKESLHAQCEPYQVGGSMVHSANWECATWAKAPYKFEAGTPPIAQAIGLKAAVDYLCNNVDFEQLRAHEAALCRRIIERLSALEKITLYGPLHELKEKGHLVTFNVQGVHAHDVAAYLDTRGIAVRAGNHCAQPLSNALNISSSVRASFYFYNTIQDIDNLCDAIEVLCNQTE